MGENSQIKIGNYIFLESKIAYQKWVGEFNAIGEGSLNGPKPKEYPCWALVVCEQFSQYESDDSNIFLYEADIRGMIEHLRKIRSAINTQMNMSVESEKE